MKTVRTGFALITAVVLGAGSVGSASAQGMGRAGPPVSLELRGGVPVPTFDIADVAGAGPGFGVGVGVAVAPRVWLMADGDFGFHPGQDPGPDVNVYHYMGKVGYDLVPAGSSRWSLLVNAGAGAMTFDVRAPGAPTKTYFGINVGAKIGYAVTDRLDLLLSPQGDIAFTDADVLGTDNAWVWPFAAGLRLRL
ncbi:MAG TPA: outer membrane beta-barrel protein [Gemmatimonadota bacterium]|nr:outer membrane beta-barrel protein [Gemmatimonadota bacterium]